MDDAVERIVDKAYRRGRILGAIEGACLALLALVIVVVSLGWRS